ncbi:MAG: COX15/CtaA family protein [Alphaproteobacteria bacterium]
MAQTSIFATARPLVARWLFLCAGLVYLMVVVGGLTRLTESGLSIVEWAPIMGTLPPLNDAEWERTFALYKAFPEYQKVNQGMSLAEFKGIFWLEYIHRLIGRLIGIVIFVPWLWLVVRRRLPGRLALRLAAIFALGGAQGVLGWWMVKSGLIDDPRVSPYRLTAHLGLAVLIYALLIWTALRLLPQDRAPLDDAGRRLGKGAVGVLALVTLTILSGGFVAGLDAGLTYNTFPLMDGRLIPDGYAMLEPWPRNLAENVPAVQFNHRLLGITTLIVGTVFAVMMHRRAGGNGPLARLATALLALALLQPSLGIATLLLVVPIWLASLHQAVALALFTVALVTTYRLNQAPESDSRIRPLNQAGEPALKG